ncbi:chorismate synthase [Spirochaetia bacterium]|nr:chorismate synthase [Spirochaetia bacterium]
MGGSSTGEIFTVTTFGESHGPALGCIVDGCPAGVPLLIEDITRELKRRRPGGGGAATTRAEADEPEILSGIFEGKTLGTPIAIIVRNTAQRSADYDALKDVYRPGHADWTWEAKYGFRDHRGGGRTSGRETVGRVAAGAVAKAFLAMYGITIRAWTSSAAGITAPGPADPGFDLDEAERNPLRIPHRETAERVLREIEAIRAEGDSAGGIVSCSVTGLLPGLGEPIFGKLDARLAAAILSIGAVKGIEFGSGFAAADSRGSVQNDRPLPGGDTGDSTAVKITSGDNNIIEMSIHSDSNTVGAIGGGVTAFPVNLPTGVPALGYAGNNAGGVLGGISTGGTLEFRAAFKPVPSIAKEQQTVDRAGSVRELVIRGRHDVCVCPRAVPVVEAMTALVLADLVLLHRGARV